MTEKVSKVMKMNFFRLGLLGLILLPAAVNAQETGISNTTLTTCGGFLVDTGMSASDYGPNEDITMTICPEAPETVLTLYFALAALGAGDVLEIYDGEDTSAPLLGSFIEYGAQGLEIFGSENNASGCLTIHFTSDASVNGSFVAEMSCGYPCERPFAIVFTEDEPDMPVLACVGEELTFNGTNTSVADGFEIATWDWDFDDGNTENSGPVVTHSFDNPGAYKVQLFVADNNITEDEPDGCENNNLVDHLVLVSTAPDFSGTTLDATICEGQTFELDGNVAGVTYDSNPSANFGGALFIPDDQSQCFSAELTYTAFNPGAVVVNGEQDLESLYINFEHSFMGDLTISLICPDGSSMTLHEQGGGGTWLGEPVDVDAQPNDEGVGYDYWWSPTAVNGTWANEGASVSTLPSGTYSATSPWSLLEGCPLNGTWTVEICDSWGSDNGFIFDWTVNFDPDLYPDPIVFTPEFGLDCDSTSWTGPNIMDVSDDCSTVEIFAAESGAYNFSATNNFGCTYENQVEITVVQGPELALSPDTVFCGAPVDISGTVTNQQLGFNYSYGWEPADLVTNSSSPNTTVNNVDEITYFNLTVSVTGGDLDNCEITEAIEVDVLPGPVALEHQMFEICLGESVALQVGNQPASLDAYNYEWIHSYECTDPFTGLPTTCNDVVSNNPAYAANEDGLYTVNITMAAPCTFGASSTYEVETEVCELLIPNVFSPDRLGKNDAFRIDGLNGYPNSTIRIYNRWGQLVFSHDDFGNSAGWDPTAEAAAEGTYFYVLAINRTASELVINNVEGQTVDDGQGPYLMSGSFMLVR